MDDLEALQRLIAERLQALGYPLTLSAVCQSALKILVHEAGGAGVRVLVCCDRSRGRSSVTLMPILDARVLVDDARSFRSVPADGGPDLDAMVAAIEAAFAKITKAVAR